MKLNSNIAVLSVLGLAIAGPVSAAGIAYNPVIPIHPRPVASAGQQLMRPGTADLRLRSNGVAHPDLVIVRGQIKLAQSCHPGAPILYVTATVKNIGKAGSHAKQGVGLVQARESVNTNWGNGHGLPALAPGQATTVNFPIYYLQSSPSSMIGPHSFNLRLNAGKWINESNYANNNYGPIAVNIPARLCGLGPDITSHKGPTIGGKFVSWGGSVTVGRKNANRIGRNGMCVFEVNYPMSDDGKAATKPAFVNRLRDGLKITALNSNLHLNAGETSSLQTEQAFFTGRHVLKFSLDDGHAVAETNEYNNVFKVTVNVDKTCNAHLRRMKVRKF